MSKELKPCRRCGLDVSSDGIEVTQTATGTYTARFECPDCGEVAETCMRHSSEDFAIADVIDDWNRRWIDPALTARIEELEAERDQLREALEKIAEMEAGSHEPSFEMRGCMTSESCMNCDEMIDIAREALGGVENVDTHAESCCPDLAGRDRCTDRTAAGHFEPRCEL